MAAVMATGAVVNATQPFLFIGVLSQPASIERRSAVRETWMATASPEVAFKFVLYRVRTYNPHNLGSSPMPPLLRRQMLSKHGLLRSREFRHLACTPDCAQVHGYDNGPDTSRHNSHVLDHVRGCEHRRRRRRRRWKKLRRTAT